MKTRIISFLSAAALLAGCYEDAGELGVDTATRIALSPAEIGFTADGTTVDGKVAYVGVVQVMPFEKGRYTWRAEGDVAWATVGETVVDESFADTWTGAVTTTRMRAVEIMATPNTEYRRSGVLTVTAEDGMRRLNTAEIYYIESDGHTVHFYTENGDFSASGLLKNFEKKLAGRPFARCNNCYLVNLAQVAGIAQEIVKVGPHSLPVSRTKRRAFLDAMSDYIDSASAV